jgi:hypothetical protein
VKERGKEQDGSSEKNGRVSWGGEGRGWVWFRAGKDILRGARPVWWKARNFPNASIKTGIQQHTWHNPIRSAPSGLILPPALGGE